MKKRREADERKNKQLFDDEEEGLDWNQMFLQEQMVGEPQQIPQSVIYELVNETINKDVQSISCPRTAKKIFWYILFMPLTHI